jgi:hypothetical protein
MASDPASAGISPRRGLPATSDCLGGNAHLQGASPTSRATRPLRSLTYSIRENNFDPDQRRHTAFQSGEELSEGAPHALASECIADPGHEPWRTRPLGCRHRRVSATECGDGVDPGNTVGIIVAGALVRVGPSPEAFGAALCQRNIHRSVPLISLANHRAASFKRMLETTPAPRDSRRSRWE